MLAVGDEMEGMMARYDVIYMSDKVTLAPHFCRGWDETGCFYGTKPVHGMSIEEACKEIADHYQRQADDWRNMTHPDVKYYTEGANQ